MADQQPTTLQRAEELASTLPPLLVARNRGIDRAQIGSELTDPNIDFAKLAEGLGVYSEGPIDNPADLGPALRRAIAVVKRGEPALVDVVTQVR